LIFIMNDLQNYIINFYGLHENAKYIPVFSHRCCHS